VAAFRAALLVDIRQHRLAWSVIGAGFLACGMLWGSIMGLPMTRPAAFEMAVPTVGAQIEHPIALSREE
jgi:hypothetical protein